MLWWLVPVVPAFLAWLYYDGWWDDPEQLLTHLGLALIPVLNWFMLLGSLLLIYDHWKQHGTRGMGFFK